MRVVTPYSANPAVGELSLQSFTVFPRPAITAVVPNTGPVEEVAIYGTNFGATQTELVWMMLGTKTLLVNSEYRFETPTMITGRARPQMAAAHVLAFTLMTSIQCPSLATPLAEFSFTVPTVVGATILLPAGGLVTITGTNFGSADYSTTGDAIAVTVEGLPCGFLRWVSGTEVQCRAPPGRGAFRNSTLRFAGHTVPFEVSYLPTFRLRKEAWPDGFPAVLVRSAEVRIEDYVVVDSPDEIAAVQVLENTNAVVFSNLPNFTWGAGGGGAANNVTLTYKASLSEVGTARLTVGVQTTKRGVVFTAPALLPEEEQQFTLTVDPYPPPSVTAAFPDSWSNCGGTYMTIYGSFLAETAADLQEVRVGPDACVRFDWLSAERVGCLRPKGSSGRFTVTSTVARTVYDKVAALNLVPTVRSLDPSWNHVLLETALTLRGENLGADAGDLVSVSLAGRPCGAVEWVSAGEVRCRLGAETRPAAAAVTVVSKVYCAGTTGSFEWLGPTVSAVEPASGVVAGGYVVTLLGERLGTPEAGSFSDVALGPVRCASASFLTATAVLCVAAPSVKASGLVATLRTAVGGAAASTALFAYTPNAPVITAVSPLVFVRSGGDPVTVYGSLWTYDETVPRQVYVGGVACQDTVWVSVNATVCLMPAYADVQDAGGQFGLFLPETDGVRGTPLQVTPTYYDVGVEFRWGLNRTNEDGEPLEVEVYLSVPCVLPVTVRLMVPDQTEARVVNSVTFESDSFDVPQTVTIVGVMDAWRDGDTEFGVVTLPTVSKDPYYDGNDPRDLTFVNGDSAPVITAVVPGLSFLAGRDVTIFGYNFDRNVSLDFSGVVVNNTDIVKILTRNAKWVPPANASGNATVEEMAAAAGVFRPEVQSPGAPAC